MIKAPTLVGMAARDRLRRFFGWLSPAYGGAIAWRNRRFDANVGVVTMDRPVISVGNLSTGGTGKTPFTMSVLGLLRASGHTPALAMRGYGAPKGQGLLADEAREYQDAFQGLPIVAQPNRIDGLIALFGTEAGERVDVVVLDDGFQHRQLARQLDIVLIDASKAWSQQALLPRGDLREEIASLARAHVLVLTRVEPEHAGNADDIERAAQVVSPALVVARTRHEWTSLRVMTRVHEANAAVGEQPVAFLRGKRAFVACAIGNPVALLAQAERATGTALVGSVVLPDHDACARGTIASILSTARDARADVLLMTRKDWTKIGRELATMPEARSLSCPIVVPRLGIAWMSGEARVKEVVLRAAAHRDDPDPDVDAQPDSTPMPAGDG